MAEVSDQLECWLLMVQYLDEAFLVNWIGDQLKLCRNELRTIKSDQEMQSVFYSRYMYPINLILQAVCKHHQWKSVSSLLQTISDIYKLYV
jgi:hypothetical protein